jgi:hypothetical protein
MDQSFARIRELINQMEAVENELGQLVTGSVKERRPQRCGKCGEEGHSARTCTKTE